VVIIFPLTIAITGGIGYLLLKDYKEKVTIGWKFVDGDIKYSSKNLFYFPILTAVAGIAAGLMGIGGGMVKGPVLLTMGATPMVQSATSSFMILFTASSTSIQFIILGLMPYDYALWYFCWGFAATFVGNLYINHLVKKYKKQAIIILLLTIVIGLSAILLAVSGTITIIDTIAAGHPSTFTSIC